MTTLYRSTFGNRAEAVQVSQLKDFEGHNSSRDPESYVLGGGNYLNPSDLDKFNQNGGRPYGNWYTKPW